MPVLSFQNRVKSNKIFDIILAVGVGLFFLSVFVICIYGFATGSIKPLIQIVAEKPTCGEITETNWSSPHTENWTVFNVNNLCHTGDGLEAIANGILQWEQKHPDRRIVDIETGGGWIFIYSEKKDSCNMNEE